MKLVFIKLFSVVIIILCTLVAKANDSDTTQNNTLVKRVEKWYSENINYGNITVLMIVESSFIPFPSEVVIPPAAYIASKPDSKLNIFLVVLFGTLGALIGAFINYFLALWLGRPIIYKFVDSKIGHFCLLNGAKIQKAEDYFVKHGKISTFVGRLLPAIRQLISIPAGLAKMNFISFTLFTGLGALLWNAILALLGYIAHGQSDLIDKYNHEISIISIILIGIVIAFIILKKLLKRKK